MNRSPSPWWALLILPAGLLVGWLVGQLPTPGPAASSRLTVNETGASASAEIEKPTRQSSSAEVSQWTTLESAMAESARNGKPVLIDFAADWCPPCQAMKREVFEGARGVAVQTAVIPVSIVDRAREEGRNPPEIERLQRQYQVRAFPTLVVFSPANGRMKRIEGFGGGDGTLAWIEGAARAVR